MPRDTIYWRHLKLPLFAFALVAPLLALSSLDLVIAHALFFDPLHMRWIGGRSWWTNDLIHHDGTLLVRSLAASALVIWCASWVQPRWREWRRPALYFFCSVALSVGLVGVLKIITNVDCPRDLAQFGGVMPFVHLFARRPENLRHAQCFPAAHASSGYALLALYFVCRERSRRAARLALGCGILMGLIFGIAQQSRGAHFISHDVWSAMLVWMMCLSLYTVVFKARLWNLSPVSSPQWPSNDANAVAYHLPVDGPAELPGRVGPAPGA